MGYGIFIVIQWSIRSYFIEPQWICRIPCCIPYENGSRTGVRILPIISCFQLRMKLFEPTKHLLSMLCNLYERFLCTVTISQVQKLMLWGCFKGTISDSLRLRKIFKPFRNKEKYLSITPCTIFPQNIAYKRLFIIFHSMGPEHCFSP